MDCQIKKFKCDSCGKFKKIIKWRAEYSSLGYICDSCFKKYIRIKDQYYPDAKRLKLI